ncbi:MAG: carbamoyltransferase [Candidatus Omnitrophica bacterium]|nr:carbamoyltransferase [Candidatus Omnitrophota bacterium]
MTYILGLSCYYHDSAAALLKEGALVAAAQEERFSRIKHDCSFPEKSIRFCLNYAGITERELSYVIFHEKPFLKFERLIKTILSTYPKSANLFCDAATTWLKDKLWIKAKIADFLEISEDKILFSKHHLSHAASAFFCSPFEKAAILTADGVGEWATTTLGLAQTNSNSRNKNEIKILKQVNFPHSLGLLYSVFTAFLGFKVNEGEYKVMGMGAFGKPKYTDKIYKLIEISKDNSFKLNMRYFSYHYSTRHSFNNNFIKLFGQPRIEDSDFYTVKPKSDCTNSQELEKNIYYADIAASIQKVTEDALIKIASYLYSETKIKNLCLSGGVALNCVANYKILKEAPFENIYIQPSAGDSGAALGAALYLWHCPLNNEKKYTLGDAYWGKEYSNREITDFLTENNISYKNFDTDTLLDYTAENIKNKKVIGWFQGRFEWGPRALGNRSILADPRDPQMKDTLNLKIKFREPFRPFAPSVLAEYAEEFFSIDDINSKLPFKFMLYTVKVKKPDLIPAATHIDKTARVQIVDREDNVLYYNLIESFRKKTGIPLLVNTSFNLKGEPIVDSPKDAYRTFKNSGIDILVMGNQVIEK